MHTFSDVELMFSCWQRDKNYRQYVIEAIFAGEYVHSLTSFNTYYCEWDRELSDESMAFIYEIPSFEDVFRL